MTNAAREEAFCLFFSNLELIRANEATILENEDYYLCEPGFSGTGLLGRGKLLLGQLLSGWRDAVLIETCPDCTGLVLVYYYGGIFSYNDWNGYCTACGASKHGKYSKRLWDWVRFVDQHKRTLSVGGQCATSLLTLIGDLKF